MPLPGLAVAALAAASASAQPQNVANWSLAGPWGAENLGEFSGLAFAAGALYVSGKGVNEFIMLDGASGAVLANRTLDTPHGCAAADGAMFVGTPNALYALDLADLTVLALTKTIGDTEYIRAAEGGAGGATVFASVGEDIPAPGKGGWSVVAAFDSRNAALSGHTTMPSKIEFFSLVPPTSAAGSTLLVAASPDSKNTVVVADWATGAITTVLAVPEDAEPHVAVASNSVVLVGGEPGTVVAFNLSTGEQVYTSTEESNPNSWHDGLWDEDSATLFIAGGEGKNAGGIARYRETAPGQFDFLGVLRPAGRTFAIDRATQRLFTAVPTLAGVYNEAFIAVWQL
jgi:outer membrane protein assembly factor BamB